jgi:hypothetical protein
MNDTVRVFILARRAAAEARREGMENLRRCKVWTAKTVNWKMHSGSLHEAQHVRKPSLTEEQVKKPYSSQIPGVLPSQLLFYLPVPSAYNSSALAVGTGWSCGKDRMVL